MVENDSVALVMYFNIDPKGSVAGLCVKCLDLLYLPTSPTVYLLCGQISLGNAEDLNIYSAGKIF